MKHARRRSCDDHAAHKGLSFPLFVIAQAKRGYSITHRISCRVTRARWTSRKCQLPIRPCCGANTQDRRMFPPIIVPLVPLRSALLSRVTIYHIQSSACFRLRSFGLQHQRHAITSPQHIHWNNWISSPRRSPSMLIDCQSRRRGVHGNPC